MLPETALARLVEDEGVSVADRVSALRLIPHPALCMLRRLLHRSRTEPSPVPSKLLAAATLAYAKEVQVRKTRPPGPTYRRPRRPQEQLNDQPVNTKGNSLGILLMALMRKLLAKQKLDSEKAQLKRANLLEKRRGYARAGAE